MQNPQNLIWIDLEMTGLDPDRDVIIEMATIVTDSDLNTLAEGPVIAIHQPEEILAGMDEWNTRQHGQSGLTQRVRESTVSMAEAEAQTLAFLEQWVPKRSSPICGNSICQDRRFLYRHMPRLEGYFHYRNLDVSTLKELAARWAPQVRESFQEGQHPPGAGRYPRVDRRAAPLSRPLHQALIRPGRAAGAGWARFPVAPQGPFHVLADQLRREPAARLQRLQHRDGRGRVAQPHRQVAQPTFVAGAAQRRTLGAAEELLLAPEEQFGEFGVVQAVARLEVALPGGAGEAIPWADDLAVVAAEYPVADQWPQLQRNRALVLDGQVGDAASRVQPVGADEGRGRADVRQAEQRPQCSLSIAGSTGSGMSTNSSPRKK